MFIDGKLLKNKIKMSIIEEIQKSFEKLEFAENGDFSSIDAKAISGNFYCSHLIFFFNFLFRFARTRLLRNHKM
jgi:hypothetical protein